MAGERYVALGLAGVRSPWFTEVARWSTVGSVPVEFVKCLSAEEVRARLGSGRAFSALLVDGDTGALDRDLLDLANGRNCAVVVVDDGRNGREWTDLGVAVVLSPRFSREELLEALDTHARMIGGASSLPVEDSTQPAVPVGWRGRLVAVAGSGGTGTSSVAVAAAQGFADDKRYAGHVVLADLALHADQAMLHDARDVVPGVQELVEAHRSRRPGPEEVRRLTFDVVNRGYQLLLGLRRHRDWAVLRPRSFEAAVDGLRQAFRVVVADIDADLEGEAECGSIEVEERNVMARTVARQAEAVVLVGMPGVKGIHGLVRSVNEFRGHGVAPERILAVVNAAGRNQRARAEITRTFADLTGAASGTPAVVGPIFLGERRALDELHRDGARLPGGLTGPVTGALHAILDRAGELASDTADPVAVTPGSLGTWAGQQASAS